MLNPRKRLRIAKGSVSEAVRKVQIKSNASSHSAPKDPLNNVIMKNEQYNSKELLSLFTDCISALSTNKICSRNAFEVGIIDHIDDLVNLSGDSSDDDIRDLAQDEKANEGITGDVEHQNRRLNFTRASKVVESASRIYGYRIEAIYDQTFNVLMNIKNVSNQDGPASLRNEPKVRDRTNRKMEFTDGSKTLSSELDITLSEIPVDNTILDPHFLKISSMFDQSGVQGLLLTNLMVSDDLTLSLDGDSLVFPEHEQKKDEDFAVFVDTELIKSEVLKDFGELSKLEILPEVTYFKNELQRLVDAKNKIVPGQQASISQAAEDELSNVVENDTKGDIGISNVGVEDNWPEFACDNDFEIFSGSSVVGDLSQELSQQKDSQTALVRRLEAIDVERGSQFSYYTNSTVGFSSAKASSIKPEDKTLTKKNEKIRKIKDGYVHDLKSFMSNPLETELDGIELSTSVVPSKSLKRAYNVLSADDSTGILFSFDERLLTRFCTLGNRAMKISNDHDWYSNVPDRYISPTVLKIYCANDTDAPFSFKRLDEYLPWKDGDILDFNAHKMLGFMEKDCNSDREASSYGVEDVFNALEIPDEPMGISIDTMYENDFDVVWSFSPTLRHVTKLEDPTKSPEPSDAVSATGPSYLDIFKIKKTLCGVILPSPEFQEAFEDQKSLDRAMASSTVEKETSISFQQAITDTVSRLSDREVASLNARIMFVCLLHVCNEHSLLIRQDNPLDDFQICAYSPKERHLGDYSESLSHYH